MVSLTSPENAAELCRSQSANVLPQEMLDTIVN